VSEASVPALWEYSLLYLFDFLPLSRWITSNAGRLAGAVLAFARSVSIGKSFAYEE
jgi:hypothetical protein